MKKKSILSIFLVIVMLFSLVGCTETKEQTIKDKNDIEVSVKKDNSVDFWDIRKEVESAKVFESYKRVISKELDNSKDIAIETKTKCAGESKDSILTIKGLDYEYSGNIITYPDYSYVEVELLNSMLHKTFFGNSVEEETETISDEELQLKKDIENIYIESFFDGIDKKYVQATEDVMSVDLDMSINFTNSETLLKLVDLYDSKLISKNGDVYSFNLTKSILAGEIESVANLLKTDTETYLPMIYNLICELEGLLKTFDASSNITVEDVKNELSSVMSGKISYNSYKETLNNNTGNLRDFLNNIVTISPEFSLTCDITKNDKLYNSNIVYIVEKDGEILSELRLNEEVTILDNVTVNLPEEYNSIEDFKNTPYYAFSQGDMDALLNVVDRKMREKYGSDYETMLEMLETME